MFLACCVLAMAAHAQPTDERPVWSLSGVVLDYVINRLEEDPTFVVGYYDVQAKLSRRKGPHQWSLFLLHGHSVWEDQEPGQGRGSAIRADAGMAWSSRWAGGGIDRG